jgi:KEOPS complex subunit Pcc1
MRRATITFAGPEAKVVHGALRPEAGRDLPKAQVTLRSSRDRVTLTIDAEDTSALRAAVNSYLRWADVAIRVRREAQG